MPSKNTLKTYLENGYYHIYNRGVEKRIIFNDSQDYAVFLNYLKEYLLPKDTSSLQSILASPGSSSKEKDKALKLLKLNNFAGKITLLAFCLMPNHFHLLIQQSEANLIDMFMQSIGTRYTMYFNRKHKRIGPLYQEAYKAVVVNKDEQLLHLTRYIHKQALASQGVSLRSWDDGKIQEVQPCSLAEYTGTRNSLWVKPEVVLDFFKQSNPHLDYQKFVLETDDELIGDITFDEE